MHVVPKLAIDNRLVLSGINSPLVRDLAHIGDVVDQFVNRALVEELAISVADALGSQFLHQLGSRAELDEALEDRLYQRSLGFVGDELAVLDQITEGRDSSH